MKQKMGERSTDKDNIGIVQEISEIRKALDTLRAEMSMKMSIVEQVLNNRNEQFQVQKELLIREEALYKTVMVHWKSIAELAENGLSLQFSTIAAQPKVTPFESQESKSNFGKLPSSSKARRDRRKRLTIKRMRFHATDDEDDEDFDLGKGNDQGQNRTDEEDQDEIPMDTQLESMPPSPNDSTGNIDSALESSKADVHSKRKENDSLVVSEVLEEKVFINMYSPASGSKIYSKPIWKYFLREENGDSILCKVCDQEGRQTIRKGHPYRHLQLCHPTICAEFEQLRVKTGETNSVTKI